MWAWSIFTHFTKCKSSHELVLEHWACFQMHLNPDKLHSFGRLAGLVVPVSDHLQVLVLDHVECIINCQNGVSVSPSADFWSYCTDHLDKVYFDQHCGLLAGLDVPVAGRDADLSLHSGQHLGLTQLLFQTRPAPGLNINLYIIKNISRIRVNTSG